MTDGNTSALPKEMLWQDYYTNLKGALSSMRRVFRTRGAGGLTQDDIAKSLNIDKSLVSRRLNGEENFTLKTLSFMATAMRCRLNIQFKPYEELGEGNNYSLEGDARENASATAIDARQPPTGNERNRALEGIPN